MNESEINELIRDRAGDIWIISVGPFLSIFLKYLHNFNSFSAFAFSFFIWLAFYGANEVYLRQRECCLNCCRAVHILSSAFLYCCSFFYLSLSNFEIFNIGQFSVSLFMIIYCGLSIIVVILNSHYIKGMKAE